MVMRRGFSVHHPVFISLEMAGNNDKTECFVRESLSKVVNYVHS